MLAFKNRIVTFLLTINFHIGMEQYYKKLIFNTSQIV